MFAMRPAGGGRPLQPKAGRGDSPFVREESDTSDAKGSAKRRCVSTACIPCRKRKSKCDGGTPKCSTCTAVYKTECSYDAEALEAARRKTVGLKRDISSLTDQNTNLDFVLSQIRSASEAEALDILHQIRSEGNIDSIADAIRKNDRIPRRPDPGGLEGNLSHLTGDPAARQKLCYGHTSGLGLVQTDSDFNSQRAHFSPSYELPSTWTDVTTDMDFIKHLLRLYFTWSNPFYPLVKEDVFYRDMERGSSNYCSSLLVNAMCAYACHFTDLPAARKNPEDPKTMGDHFFDKARQLLHDDYETSCFTTVQALAIMSVREASAGRDSTGFRYCGRALRMAIELGMHLDPLGKPTVEDDIRKDVFWGLFVLETAWSVCIGRVSQLPRTAVQLESPVDFNTNGSWQAYNDNLRHGNAPILECDHSQFLRQFTTISFIVNDMTFMFFAPRERMNSKKVLDLYRRYQGWYRQLPRSLLLTDRTPPHIYLLHMYYWTCIIHLFRPIVKIDLVNSSVYPRELCIDAAIQISRICDDYRRLFPKRTVHLFQSHVLLSSGTIHLLDLPAKGQSAEAFTNSNIRALKHVSETLQDLVSMSQNHVFAARVYQIIRKVGEQNGLLLPGDALEKAPEKSTTTSPVPFSFFDSNTASTRSTPASYQSTLQDAQSRADKQFTLQLPDGSKTRSDIASHPSPNTPLSAGSGTPSSTTLTPMSSSTPQSSLGPLASRPPSSAPITQQHPTPATSSSDNRPTKMFWTPFEGQGIPLYGGDSINQSPMDLSNMLGSVDMYEQLSRDGFRMSNLWGQDPMLGAIWHTQAPSDSVFNAPNGPQVVDPGNQAGASAYGQHWWSE